MEPREPSLRGGRQWLCLLESTCSQVLHAWLQSSITFSLEKCHTMDFLVCRLLFSGLTHRLREHLGCRALPASACAWPLGGVPAREDWELSRVAWSLWVWLAPSQLPWSLLHGQGLRPQPFPWASFCVSTLTLNYLESSFPSWCWRCWPSGEGVRITHTHRLRGNDLEEAPDSRPPASPCPSEHLAFHWGQWSLLLLTHSEDEQRLYKAKVHRQPKTM